MNKATKLITAVALTGLMTGCATNPQGENALLSGAQNAASGVASGIGNVVGGLFQPYTNGVKVDDANLQKLTPGMTPDEVEAIVGLPPEIAQSSQGEIWSYPYSEIKHFGGNINETTVIRFDNTGKLAKAYKTNSRSSASGNPLLDAANNAN